MNLQVRILATVVVAISPLSTISLQAQRMPSLFDIAADGTAQSPASSPPVPSVREPSSTPKIDIFLGYSYLRAVPELANGNRLGDLNGGRASIAFNLHRHFPMTHQFA